MRLDGVRCDDKDRLCLDAGMGYNRAENTPITGMRDETQLARHHERGVIAPGCAVEGNPAGGPNRQRPRRSHTPRGSKTDQIRTDYEEFR